MQSSALLKDVLANYQQLIDSYPVVTSDNSKHNFEKVRASIEYVCRLTYEFIENQLRSENQDQKTKPGKDQIAHIVSPLISEFKSKLFIWVESCFVNPEDVAMEWNVNGPYLYKIPSLLSERKKLLNALCIKEKFSVEKLLNCLKKMRQQPEEENTVKKYKIIDAILTQLNKHPLTDFNNLAMEDVILPSTLYTLVHAKELSYNDSKWLLVNEDSTLVHDTLKRETALKLGVKPIRSQFLEKYTTENSVFGGNVFGQKEELTQRIRNILQDYPLDATVLKELLQNADDAKATRMCVILDKRNHGKEQLPSQEWSELQGPALLVWNNEEFSEEDIKGIQKLGLGSKRDDSESIGQFGIGFNVVYHLTDCPSFISGGKTLCVFDPHCKYAPGANAINPGRRYRLEDKFWNVMSDMKDSYFQSQPLENQPSGIEKGSLFRFPLRCTQEQIMNSRIVEQKVRAKVLTAKYMEDELDDWVLQIKDALVFLNHITEFSYYVVDNDDKKFHLKCKYKVTMGPSAAESRFKMFEGLKQFKSTSNGGLVADPNDAVSTDELPCVKPCVFNYQIQLDCTELIPPDTTSSSLSGLVAKRPCMKNYSEKWLIQQGVGDIDKPSTQKWHFISKVLPKHGIAVPVTASQDFIGKIFCFLPLQIQSGLHVHINGQFVLKSNRRSLWAGSTEGNDEKRDWNDTLFEAIASSYAYLLTNARDVIVKPEEYTSKTKLFQCINYYYSLFPLWTSMTADSRYDQKCLRMGKLVFQKLWNSNAGILATDIYLKDNLSSVTHKVQWNTLKNELNPFQQPYFQPQLALEEKKKVLVLLRCIKMKLTCAPSYIYKNLITDETIKPAIATPESVFQFYCSFHHQIFQNCPCHIQYSPFITAETFLQFFMYMMVSKQDTNEKSFPESPYGYPLLLTADNVLRCFDRKNQVIRSTYYNIFPNSLSSFLHELFLELHVDSEYFLESKYIGFTTIESLLRANFPSQLHQRKLNNDEIHDITLISFWNCLTSDEDPLLKSHQKKILETCALIPATDGYLYSTSSNVIPIIPYTHEGDRLDSESFEIFSSLGLPVINDSVLSNLHADFIETYGTYFPSIKSYDQVLTILYHLHQEQHIFDNVTDGSGEIKTILKYFQKTGFTHNNTLKNYIMSLPLFKPIRGPLMSLLHKKVYVWPKGGFCDAGYDKWAPADSVVFLEYWGDWRALTNDISVFGSSLEEKIIYSNLVLPCFFKLSSDERKQHLEYILEHIYPIVKTDSKRLGNYSHISRQRQEAESFLNELIALKCIKCIASTELRPVCDFSDHTSDIFNTFSDSFIFLPQEYQEDKWFEFFCDLGLQITVSAEKFIEFCLKVEKRSHDNTSLKDASSVLLKYLFDKGKGWSDYELQKIAKICFVTVADVPHLSWIKAPCSPPLEIPGVINLTSLNCSVLLKHAPLIWTVKSVFKQPEINKDETILKREAFLEKLSVTQPSVAEVIQNLSCISKSRLSSMDLFTNYDSELACNYDELKLNLVDVVSKCLEELQRNQEECQDLLLQLKDCACVPVSAKPALKRGSKPTHVVLVRPIQVVKSFSQGDDHFKPYINELPNCLANYSSVFELLGVQSTINLNHLRYVLEILYLKLNGGRTDDPNEIRMIRKSIVKLNELMSKDGYSKKEAAICLNQLYLPFSFGKYSWSLKPSNNLLFVDSSRHRSRNPKNFNLAETKYSLFTIPPDDRSSISNIEQQRNSFTNFMVNEKDFCKLLPKEVRPLQLSLYSYEKRLDVGSITQDNSHAIACLIKSKDFTQKHLQTSLLQNMLIYHMNFNPDTDVTPFIQAFLGIMTNIKLISIKGLRASLFLTGGENIPCCAENIGTLTSPKFVLEKEFEADIYDYTLYVDETQEGNRPFLNELSRSLLMEIARINKTNLTTYFKMIDPICSFFEVRSIANMKAFAESYDIQLTPADKEEDKLNDDASPIPCIGKQIPEEFLCRLDNSINNVFYPQEWVVYEVAEEQYVWAMVLYPAASGSDDDTKLDRYIIANTQNHDDNDEGKEISVVDIYKIISEVVHEDEVFEQALVPLGKLEGDTTNILRLVKDSQTILAMKENICADLRQIANIADETEKRKAIKRLYLLYHPDKASLSNKDMYEKVFQFLLRQIEQLDKGLHLEDPEDDDEANVSKPSQKWSTRFNQWSGYVSKHSRNASQRREKTFNEETAHFDFTEYKSQPDLQEANRWLKQAYTDFKAMTILLTEMHCHGRGDRESVVCQVIFLARETIEKSLKAGMYKLVGLNPGFLTNHELLCHARSISSQRSSEITFGIVSLETIACWIDHFYLDSRYPNRYAKYSAPVDVCSIDDAKMAAEYAKITIKYIESL